MATTEKKPAESFHKAIFLVSLFSIAVISAVVFAFQLNAASKVGTCGRSYVSGVAYIITAAAIVTSIVYVFITGARKKKHFINTPLYITVSLIFLLPLLIAASWAIFLLITFCIA